MITNNKQTESVTGNCYHMTKMTLCFHQLQITTRPIHFGTENPFQISVSFPFSFQIIICLELFILFKRVWKKKRYVTDYPITHLRIFFLDNKNYLKIQNFSKTI